MGLLELYLLHQHIRIKSATGIKIDGSPDLKNKFSGTLYLDRLNGVINLQVDGEVEFKTDRIVVFEASEFFDINIILDRRVLEDTYRVKAISYRLYGGDGPIFFCGEPPVEVYVQYSQKAIVDLLKGKTYTENTQINIGEKLVMQIRFSDEVVVFAVKSTTNDKLPIVSLNKIHKIAVRLNAIITAFFGVPVCYDDITIKIAAPGSSDSYAKFALGRFEDGVPVSEEQIAPFAKATDFSLENLFSNMLIRDVSPAQLWRLFVLINMGQMRGMELILYCLYVAAEGVFNQLSENDPKTQKRIQYFDSFVDKISNDLTSREDEKMIEFLRRRCKNIYVDTRTFGQKLEILFSVNKVNEIEKTFCNKSTVLRNSLMHCGVVAGLFGEVDAATYMSWLEQNMSILLIKWVSGQLTTLPREKND